MNKESTVAYEDGTYSAMGTYVTPGGRESINVTVTIENGIIIRTDVDQNAISLDAKDFQARFVSGYKKEVISKKIDKVSLSRVAGSSLTSHGFNKALTQIKSDAS